MKRGLKRILCVSAFLAAGLGTWVGWKILFPPEPVYNGKTLTAWIEQRRSSFQQSNLGTHAPIPEAAKEAEEAFLGIGTNGIPYLLRLIRSKESATIQRLRRTLPDSWLERLGLEDDEYKSIKVGSWGLYLLGTNASPAVPALMELLSTELTRSPVDERRISSVMVPLRSMKNGADPAIPLLIECLTNTNHFVRREAARTLGRFYHKPEIVVPALVKFLSLQKQPDRIDEMDTIISFGMFGTNAASAAPALIGYLTDPDPTFREAATNCLRRVDPSAAERAGVRIYRTR